MAIEFQRERLYQAIWETPIGQLAYKCGITSARLHEVCEMMSIPLPPLGHWNTVRAGKEVAIAPLLAHDGPSAVTINSARPKSWAIRTRAVKLLLDKPDRKKQPSASAPLLPIPVVAPKPAILSRYVTLMEWAATQFSKAPHINTLLKWVHEGRIQPQPVKIGRKWWVLRNAEYRPD